jgi:hypothetical protein
MSEAPDIMGGSSKETRRRKEKERGKIMTFPQPQQQGGVSE